MPVEHRPAVVLFLPAHDEEAAVAAVVARVPATIDGHPVRCIVIDDGSTDRTAQVAAAAGAEVVRLGDNQGLGAAVRAGLAAGLAAGAVAVAFCDADGEYAPEELADLVRPILVSDADYVVGSRFAGGRRRMRPHRWAGNRALTWWVAGIARRHFGVRGLSDGQSGYRALSAAAAADAEVVHDFNYAQVLTLDLLAKGYRYAEVPISYRFRTTGRSFVRLLPYLRQVVPAVRVELRGGANPELAAAVRT
jgi:glycosyltransferase involved in cell wall biosynthesis